jgi:hypothetical protein
VFPWSALIGIAVSLVKLFATSAASSAGAAAGQLIVSRIGAEKHETVVAASQPTASRQQQLSASQELLTLLRNDPSFREEVQSILSTEARDALALGRHVEKELEQAPAVVEQVVSGAKPVTELAFPLGLWSVFSMPALSPAQTQFLQSNTFHQTCPVGGEDLGFDSDAVRYEVTSFGTTQRVRLPTVLLHFPPESYSAICKNSHRWSVFAH